MYISAALDKRDADPTVLADTASHFSLWRACPGGFNYAATFKLTGSSMYRLNDEAFAGSINFEAVCVCVA